MSNEDGPKGGISNPPSLKMIRGGLDPSNSRDHSNVFNIYPDSEVEISDNDIEFLDQHISRLRLFFKNYQMDKVQVSQDTEGKPFIVLLTLNPDQNQRRQPEDFALLISPEQIDIAFQVSLGRLPKDSKNDEPEVLIKPLNDTDLLDNPSIDAVFEQIKRAIEIRPELRKFGFSQVKSGASDLGPYYEYHLRRDISPNTNVHYSLEDEIFPLLENVMECLGFEQEIENEPA